VPIIFKSGSLNLPELSGSVQACNGIALLLPLPSTFIYMRYEMWLNGHISSF
jgi:hypothetical protein